MAELKAEYVNAFIMATHSLLTQMCMIAEVKVGKPSLEPAKFPEDTSLILIGRRRWYGERKFPGT